MRRSCLEWKPHWPIIKRLNDILFILNCSAMSYFVSMHHFQLDLHDLFNKQVSFHSLHFLCMTLLKMTIKNLGVKTALIQKSFLNLSFILANFRVTIIYHKKDLEFQFIVWFRMVASWQNLNISYSAQSVSMWFESRSYKLNSQI
jgi:hypothetical protein